MTQEKKELLIKDLCARLPYGVKGIDKEEKITIRAYIPNSIIDDVGISHSIENIKPYLYPFSSMTEEATREFYKTLEWVNTSDGDSEGVMTYDSFDCLNKYHIDYHGLIPIGLANDATGLNIY